MASWQRYIKGYQDYLKIERSLSENSISAYIHDIRKLEQFCELADLKLMPTEIQTSHIQQLLGYLAELGIASTSCARILSGMKGFFRYLTLENINTHDPSELLEMPSLPQKLPQVLNLPEVEAIFAKVDMSRPDGVRNRAIVELLYSSGLRVTEAVELKISNLYLNIGFVKVQGKGSKERFVPIGKSAIKYLEQYLADIRPEYPIKPKCQDDVFLNRRGSRLSRVMVFYVIKDLANLAGITKNISPHTFRHTFATHLIEGGADLRAVQQMLGHESLTTTELYTHLDTEFLRQTILDFHPRS